MADETVRNKKAHGFLIRSWSDVVSISVLVAMLMSTVMWGLKLEGEVNTVRSENVILRNDLTEVEKLIAAGVLPRADERIMRLEVRLNELKARVDRHIRVTSHEDD